MSSIIKDTVLFVDDEEINLFLFEKTFERDFHLLTALSGMEGLEKLQEHEKRIKVVISDMRMPSMNGLEFVAKARSRFDKISYFILTGYSFNEELESALERKLIDKIFNKPFDYESIKEAVGLNS
ncbi:MAG: response regulator [Cyclobacteriaceae bacterium]